MLDPKTNNIGNRENVSLFIALINKINPKLKIEEFEGEITVEREKGRIDVLLFDEKGRAIIIENKINNAADQKDQIGRYYKKVKEDMKLSVKAIVYLTLTPDKQLDRKWSIQDDKIRNEIEEKGLIVPVPVINKRSEPSFSENFIEDCIKWAEAENNEIAKVYYSQYKNLIRHLGGDSMTNDLDHEAIKEIYADKKKLCAFNMFGSLWDKRKEIIWEIISDLLKGKEFQPYDRGCLYYQLNDEISFGYGKDLTWGVICSPEKKKLRKEMYAPLKSALDDRRLKNIFSDESAQKNELWVWKVVDMSKVEDLQTIIDNFTTLKEILIQKKII
jgi:hypothetical protein